MTLVSYLETVKKLLKYIILIGQNIGLFLINTFMEYPGKDFFDANAILFYSISFTFIAFVLFIIGVAVQSRERKAQLSRATSHGIIGTNQLLLFVFFYSVKRTLLTRVARLCVIMIYGIISAVVIMATFINLGICNVYIMIGAIIVFGILMYAIYLCCNQQPAKQIIVEKRKSRLAV